MSSIDSLPVENPSPQQEELNQAALREGFQLEAGVRRLVKMAGIKSLNRNLANEDEAVRRNIERSEAELFGGKCEDPAGGGGEDMDIMAAGNVTFNYGPQTPPPAQQPEQPKPEPIPAPVAVAPVTAPTTTAPMSTMKKAALAAALVGGGALLPAAGYVASNYLSKPTPAAEYQSPVFDLMPPDTN